MVKRLIDADELENKLRDYEFAMLCPLDEVDDVIDRCQTVDAVEVVRCKDCIRYRDNGYSSKDGICLDRCDIGAHEADVYEDDFCSYGERRGEA